MPDKTQLPFLIKLLDDDSLEIRQTILGKLEEFGSDLEVEISHLAIELNSAQKKLLQSILQKNKRIWFKSVWPSWFEKEDEHEKLETAMGLIAEFLGGRNQAFSLKMHLDSLSAEYQKNYQHADPASLVEFLFQTKEIRGVVKDQYYRSSNSNLIHVIETKYGIPISLVLLYILVGSRIGLEIEGCNYPGHFLARTFIRGKAKLVDCFNGGVFIDEDSLLKRDQTESTFDVVHAKADAETIISRVLRNLVRAYEDEGNDEDKAFMGGVIEDLELRRGELWLNN